MASEASLYTINSNGWRDYKIADLQEGQCDIIATTCKEEASSERYKAIAVAIGAVLAAGAIILVSIAIAKAVAPLLAGVLAKMGCVSGFEMPQAVLFSVELFSYTMTYIFGIVALKRLWDKGIHVVTDHWQYARSLDQQATDALLHKAELVRHNPA